ncbi:Gp15 family bacteriophage protein [Bacillus sp. OTU530]|uniref:Gp15 family bacteriophage protein n=1 Tax=Bacillus sp. OTU530 TaxID=3043862 RepID=UPI00313B641E
MKPFLLTSFFEDCFEYGEIVLHLDLSFDNVLRVFELFKDDVFHGYEKVDITLEMLVKEYRSIEEYDLRKKDTLFLYIFKEFLGIDLQKPQDLTNKKTFDFEQDAGIIYASFLHAYNMDLFEQQGKLHWHKFSQLIAHLPEGTKFREVIGIRTMEIPAADKHNTNYRKQVIAVKKVYALQEEQSEADAIKALDAKWDTLALMVRG